MNSKISERLLGMVEEYLKKNDFGVAHTERVLEIAKNYFHISEKLEELTTAAITLHDVGGSSIKEQYKNGPVIATKLMRELGYSDKTIEEVCEIIRTHHERLKSPSTAFKILYDSDQLVKFSKDEFPYYNLKGTNWGSVINSLYHEHAKKIAKKMLYERIEEV